MICTNIIIGEKILIDLIGGGRISVINVFDGDIYLPSFPFTTPIVIYSGYKRENNETIPEVYLELKLNDVLLSKQPINLNFNTPAQDCKAITNIQAIAISVAGTLSANIVNKTTDTIIKSSSFNFVKLNPMPAASPFSPKTK